MNERSIAVAERALIDFLSKTRREHDYFRGRLIRADNIPAPNQHMVSAAISKLSWYTVQLNELEGELEMLREELGIEETEEIEEDADQKEERGGEEKENKEYDAGRA